MRLLYVSRSSGVHDRRFVEGWRAGGVEAQALELPAAPSASRAELDSAGRRFISALRELEPDVVQVGPLTQPGALVAGLWAGPLIATSWGFDLVEEIEVSLVADAQARATIDRADLIFVDSDITHRRAEDRRREGQQIIQFPWGVNDEWFSNLAARGARERRPHPPVTLASTRSHEARYRVKDILRAFAAISPAPVDSFLELAGDGSLTPSLLALSRSLGIDERVRFLGRLDDSGLRSLLQRADVYVTASSVDGSSVSLLEAMASGIPVIASATEGNRQWISPEAGMLFPTADPIALATALASFVTGDKHSWATAHERARQAFDLVGEQAVWRRTCAQLRGWAELAIREHAASR